MKRGPIRPQAAQSNMVKASSAPCAKSRAASASGTDANSRPSTSTAIDATLRAQMGACRVVWWGHRTFRRKRAAAQNCSSG